MIHALRISRFFIFSLLTGMLLSGCYADKSFTLLQPPVIDTDAPDVQESDDPDMALVVNEQDVCLDQELDLLSKSGQWGDETTEASPEVVADEVVYDFPVTINKQVQAYLDLFQNRQKKMFSRWLARSTRYLPYMQQELEKAGLPKDLAYLSMIESGYNQRAYSSAKAVGLWQFMRATGKQYHLRIDNYVDERRDLEKSTGAAIAFLTDLYDYFGDWHLAVAAYNAGPGKIRSGLRKHKVDNFWDLAGKRHLRLETKRYVPKLIAAIIISREPEKYGFSNIAYQKPISYSALQVGPSLSLDAVALISGSDIKTIKDLNPELRKAKTPPNSSVYTVKIPQGKEQYAASNIDRLHRYVSTGYKTHKIQRGESVAAICRRYNINTTTLLKVNNLRSSTLVAGTNLRIPYSTVKYQLLPKGDSAQLAAYKDNLILHRIKSGETISKIAKKYSVPPEMIVSWNGLQSIHRIRAGQQLALYVERTDTKSSPQSTTSVASAPTRSSGGSRSGSVPVLAAAKKISPQSATPTYRWYEVKNGDSLWTISRKFNVSAAEIKKLNNLKSNLIHPGSKLKVKNV